MVNSGVMMVKNKVHARALIYFVEGETTQSERFLGCCYILSKFGS